MNYISIDKDLIPYKFEITLENTTYTFEVYYNAVNDFFTIDLSKNNEILVLGEKLIYAKPLFLTSRHKDIPKINIIPYDISETAKRITFDNLNESVFLYLVGD